MKPRIFLWERGAILINNHEYARFAEIYREKGPNRTAFHQGEVEKYTWIEYGDSFLQSNLNAAFVWAQFEEADRIPKSRLSVWNRYMDGFKGKADKWGVVLPSIPDGCVHNAHMFNIKSRNEEIRNRYI